MISWISSIAIPLSQFLFLSTGEFPELIFWKCENGKWTEVANEAAAADAASFESLDIRAVDGDVSDDLWVISESFTRPSTLYSTPVDGLVRGDSGKKLKSQPEFYNSAGVESKGEHFTPFIDHFF